MIYPLIQYPGVDTDKKSYTDEKSYTDTGSLLPGSPGKWQIKTNKEWFYINLCK